MQYPVLYSFRRCPYAMRARLAIAISGLQVELREIVLKDKPSHMLEVSPKGTVPVLITPQGSIIEESIDIMAWALEQHDPEQWLPEPALQATTQQLIQQNDGPFKHALDRYKYADRYPEHPEIYYRQQGEETLAELEQRLNQHAFLLGEGLSMADIAILPFIRQFAAVDNNWFQKAPYPKLRQWLNQFLDTELFKQIMIKRPPWQPDDPVYLFPAKLNA